MVDQSGITCAHPIICLMGTTVSKKTELAIVLGRYFSVEIVSVDSALIYRGMDIGTAKPSTQELILVPHKLVNICDPSEYYSVADFCNDAYREIAQIIRSNHIPLLVGGSMFYFKSLLDGLSFLPKKNDKIRNDLKCEAERIGWLSLYKKLQRIDPVSAKRIHCNDRKRLLRALEVFYVSRKTLTELISLSRKLTLKNYSFYWFAIEPLDKIILYRRIEERFYYMLEMGFENEVRQLFSRIDLHESMSSISCIGYRHMWLYLSKKISYHDMVSRSIYATRHLAKHQITWLRKWANVHWLDNNMSISDWVQEIVKVVNLK